MGNCPSRNQDQGAGDEGGVEVNERALLNWVHIVKVLTRLRALRRLWSALGNHLSCFKAIKDRSDK